MRRVPGKVIVFGGHGSLPGLEVVENLLAGVVSCGAGVSLCP